MLEEVEKRKVPLRFLKVQTSATLHPDVLQEHSRTFDGVYGQGGLLDTGSPFRRSLASQHRRRLYRGIASHRIYRGIAPNRTSV